MGTADPLNFDTIICRACMVNVFDPTISFIKNSELIDIYLACTSLEVQFTDGLSLNICEKCNKMLHDFYDFRKMCVESYKKMLEFAKNKLNTEKYDDTKIEEIPVKECKVEIQELNIEIYNEEKPEMSENDDFESDDDDEKVSNFSDNLDHESSNESEAAEAEEDVREHKPRNYKTKSKKDVSTPAKKREVFACNLCNKKFHHQMRYEGHLRQHQGLKQFICEICNKGLANIKSYRRHKKESHGDSSKRRRYPCTQEGCDKKYATPEGLRYHTKKIHFGIKIPTYVCELCGKVLKTSYTLSLHKNTHAEIKPYPCSECPKRFTTPVALRDHLLRHRGVKNFACHICGARKTTKRELRLHIKNHESKKVYNCEMCSSSFRQAAYLRRHINIVHKKIKRYQCTYCDSAFGKADTLKHHVMRHTGEKPEVCPICDKRFIQVVALRAHLKTHEKYKNQPLADEELQT